MRPCSAFRVVDVELGQQHIEGLECDAQLIDGLVAREANFLEGLDTLGIFGVLFLTRRRADAAGDC